MRLPGPMIVIVLRCEVHSAFRGSGWHLLGGLRLYLRQIFASLVVILVIIVINCSFFDCNVLILVFLLRCSMFNV